VDDKFRKALDSVLFKIDIEGVIFDTELGKREKNLIKYLVDHEEVYAQPRPNGGFAYYRET